MTRIILIFLAAGSLFFSIVWDDNSGHVIIPDGEQPSSSTRNFDSPVPTPIPVPKFIPTPMPTIKFAPTPMPDLPWSCRHMPADGILWSYCRPINKSH